MNDATLNGETVKVFKCDGGALAADCGKQKTQVLATDLEFKYEQASHVLKILRKPAASQPDLDPFAWYQMNCRIK